MNIAQTVAAARRLNPVPLTVINDVNTPLAFRRTADKYDVRRALKTIENTDMVARPVIAHTARDLVRIPTRDDAGIGMLTFDQQTVDSTGAFLVGQLERLDPILHMPLAEVSWDEDIDIRTDVTIADDLSSYTVSSFAAAPGVAGSEISWVGKRANAIPSVDIDIGKTAQRIEPWARTIDWTLYELEAGRLLGRPIDDQKHEALQIKWNMDLDHVTYIGDSVMGMNGLLNHSLITNTGNAVTGNWSTATPNQILADVNEILNSAAGFSALAVLPNTILLAFPDLTLLASSLISSAGNISVLEFLLRNNASKAAGQALVFKGRKWLVGTGRTFGGLAGRGPTASNSMFAYNKTKRYVRIPVVPLLRTNLEYRDIRQLVTYYGRIGQVEMPYPETIARRANIN
jgi:hypothetical protein